MEDPGASWEQWVGEAIKKLHSVKHLMNIRPISLVPMGQTSGRLECSDAEETYETFDGLRPWDRSTVEVKVSEETVRRWLNGAPSCGEEIMSERLVEDGNTKQLKKLILFSSNNYVGLCAHPAVVNAAADAVRKYGMGPRSAPLICGYTTHHRLLESSLADLKKKQDCLLCPTGCAANMAVLTAIGTIPSVLTENGKPSGDEKVAIFSDSLNHASIIDGIFLAKRQGGIEAFVYKHCDMFHLNALLLSCTLKKKVVITDSLFSMDGDIAPMIELAKLRKKHGFLLIVDDAHGTFILGKNGGGVAEEFNCEADVDICIGTLSKAAGCQGGFIACSETWKLFIQTRGRGFIYSTALPVPVVAAARAAIVVARKEGWRRKAIWDRVKEFGALTGIPVRSPIISLVVGSEENTIQASSNLLKLGFHVIGVGPPVVPRNSCRLRVSLAAAHTAEDVQKLVGALSSCLNFQDSINHVASRFRSTL